MGVADIIMIVVLVHTPVLAIGVSALLQWGTKKGWDNRRD